MKASSRVTLVCTGIALLQSFATAQELRSLVAESEVLRAVAAAWLESARHRGAGASAEVLFREGDKLLDAPQQRLMASLSSHHTSTDLIDAFDKTARLRLECMQGLADKDQCKLQCWAAYELPWKANGNSTALQLATAWWGVSWLECLDSVAARNLVKVVAVVCVVRASLYDAKMGESDTSSKPSKGDADPEGERLRELLEKWLKETSFRSSILAEKKPGEVLGKLLGKQVDSQPPSEQMKQALHSLVKDALQLCVRRSAPDAAADSSSARALHSTYDILEVIQQRYGKGPWRDALNECPDLHELRIASGEWHPDSTYEGDDAMLASGGAVEAGAKRTAARTIEVAVVAGSEASPELLRLPPLEKLGLVRYRVLGAKTYRLIEVPETSPVDGFQAPEVWATFAAATDLTLEMPTRVPKGFVVVMELAKPSTCFLLDRRPWNEACFTQMAHNENTPQPPRPVELAQPHPVLAPDKRIEQILRKWPWNVLPLQCAGPADAFTNYVDASDQVMKALVKGRTTKEPVVVRLGCLMSRSK